jgi:hypothetical protein
VQFRQGKLYADEDSLFRSADRIRRSDDLIGFGFMIPRSCIAGFNDLTVGFASTVAGASLSYWLGMRTVLDDPKR